MTSLEDRRLNFKLLPIPPSPLTPKILTSTSIITTTNSKTTTPNNNNITTGLVSSSRSNSPHQLNKLKRQQEVNEFNSLANKWKSLEESNNNNNNNNINNFTNLTTLGVGISNLTSNNLGSIKNRSIRDSAWINTNSSSNNNSNNCSPIDSKYSGEDDLTVTSTVNNLIRTRKDSFNSNSSRDSNSKIGRSTSNLSLRTSKSTSDNFAALKAQFHSNNQIDSSISTLPPSSPISSSPRIGGPPKSPATRIPRPANVSRLSSAKSSPALASMSAFESKLSTHPSSVVPVPRLPSSFNSLNTTTGGMRSSSHTRELSSGGDDTGLEFNLSQGLSTKTTTTSMTRSSSRGSVELSELVGDVFGAIDWNSRRTGTPNKLG